MDKRKKGLIFNIQKFSLNDGSGIRTIIFFKGCPLRCSWCSNPESQSIKPEKMIDKINNNKYKEVGKYYTVEEIIKEVLKDEVFYTSSNGGVTLSGGEILSQADFVIELLKELKDNGINTAIETCGYGNRKLFEQILKYVDTVLFDLKIADEKCSIKYIGGSFNVILNNFEEACKKNKVIPRFPYIPTFTDSIENIDRILNILNENKIKIIHILPYHNYGEPKYELLGRKYELGHIKRPTKEKMEEIKKYVESKGFIVKIEG